jgi:hypothetical protein
MGRVRVQAHIGNIVSSGEEAIAPKDIGVMKRVRSVGEDARIGKNKSAR